MRLLPPKCCDGQKVFTFSEVMIVFSCVSSCTLPSISAIRTALRKRNHEQTLFSILPPLPPKGGELYLSGEVIYTQIIVQAVAMKLM